MPGSKCHCAHLKRNPLSPEAYLTDPRTLKNNMDLATWTTTLAKLYCLQVASEALEELSELDTLAAKCANGVMGDSLGPIANIVNPTLGWGFGALIPHIA